MPSKTVWKAKKGDEDAYKDFSTYPPDRIEWEVRPTGRKDYENRVDGEDLYTVVPKHRDFKLLPPWYGTKEKARKRAAMLNLMEILTADEAEELFRRVKQKKMGG